MIVNITGDENGSILIFLVFGFLRFWPFIGRFWPFFGFFGSFVGDWGVLGVLVTYMITRGIKLVVGRFTEGVKGGLREFWGFLVRYGGVKGVLLDPFRTRFAPLEVLWGTGFGSKHHIMVQLVNVYRVGITDPF